MCRLNPLTSNESSSSEKSIKNPTTTRTLTTKAAARSEMKSGRETQNERHRRKNRKKQRASIYKYLIRIHRKSIKEFAADSNAMPFNDKHTLISVILFEELQRVGANEKVGWRNRKWSSHHIGNEQQQQPPSRRREKRQPKDSRDEMRLGRELKTFSFCIFQSSILSFGRLLIEI